MFYSYTCMCMQKTKDTFSIYVRLLSSNVGSSTFGSVISKSDLEGKRKVILINNIILRKRRILILKDMNLKFTYCRNKKKKSMDIYSKHYVLFLHCLCSCIY